MGYTDRLFRSRSVRWYAIVGKEIIKRTTTVCQWRTMEGEKMNIYNWIGWSIIANVYVGFGFTMAKVQGKRLALIMFLGYPVAAVLTVLVAYLILKQ